MFGVSIKRLIFFMILIEVMLAYTCNLQITDAASPVSVQSSTGYLDYDGYYHVVGVVFNGGAQNVGLLRVDVTFYDSNNQIIATRFDSAMIDVTLVERKAPFEVVLFDEGASSKVEDYSISLEYSVEDSLPEKLVVDNERMFTDEVGLTHVTGDVTNLGTSNSHSVKIIAVFYDASKSVVAVELTYFNPEFKDLKPSETKSFDVVLQDDERAQNVDTYEIVVESNVYSQYLGDWPIPTPTPTPTPATPSPSPEPTPSPSPEPSASPSPKPDTSQGSLMYIAIIIVIMMVALSVAAIKLAR